MRKILLLAAIACVYTACETTTAKSDTNVAFNIDSVKAFIDHHNEEFSSQMINGDSVNVSKDYMNDASILPPDMPAAKGGAFMGGVAKMIKSMNATQFKVWSTDIQGTPEAVIEEGKWELRGENNMKDSGKFIVIWKQSNGQWKIAKDIWNRDAALPAAPATR